MEGLKSPPDKNTYSEAFKIKVVREYERGCQTKNDLKRKYQIRGKCLVLEWCRKYGKLYYPLKKNQGRPMKDPQKQRIKDLESELKDLKEKLLVYEKLIEITKRESGIDIKKNIGTRLSESWPVRKKS